MLKIITAKTFEKELKLSIKRGHTLKKLQDIIALLLAGKPLPPKNRNHKLKGIYTDYWECHIEPDWLLIYKKTKVAIILCRIGTHSDLF